MTQDRSTSTARNLLGVLSAHDFKTFGLHHIAYIRPTTVDGRNVAELRAADGDLLAVYDSVPFAAIDAKRNDLEPVLIQ